ncbi:MAG: hypothetical protein ACRD9Q_03630 [Nitrososphaeraceae archaeon]
MKTVPPKDPIELNRYEEFIYNTILEHDRIWVRELQKIVCDPKNQKAMGHPTFLKYLKSLEEKSLVSYVKLQNKKFYSQYEAGLSMHYEQIERFSEYEFKEIYDIISANLQGVEFLIRNPKKQFEVIYNSLLQLFGYQILIRILRGVDHPEGEENNAINEFVRKLQDLEDSVYMRTSPFMAEPILLQFGKIIDSSYLNLLKLGLWKWTEIEKSSKHGDEQAITIKRIYRDEFNENSTELIKRLRKKIRHSKMVKRNNK